MPANNNPKFRLINKFNNSYPTNQFIFEDNLYYRFKTKKIIKYSSDKSMWKYFDLIPILNKSNIISLNEGNTSLVHVPELEKLVGDCKLYFKNESENPSGTFKDREASYIITKAKELGLNKLVFHSTGNTGRAYSLYAKKAGIETFFFLPLNCINKCDSTILSNYNYIIAINGKFNQVSKIAKLFAKNNDIPIIAPIHDKIEGKATIAYEQLDELPSATIFTQTIAGGYGVMGFTLGYERMKKCGLIPLNFKIPKIFAIQSKDCCAIAKAINQGKESIVEHDILSRIEPFEKTLQSTNPLKTYESVKSCLNKTNGLIEVVSDIDVKKIKRIFENTLKKYNLKLSYKKEKSPYICFAGLIKLYKKNKINSNDIIYFVLTGSGKKKNNTPKPDAILKPTLEGYNISTCTRHLKNLYNI